MGFKGPFRLFIRGIPVEKPLTYEDEIKLLTARLNWTASDTNKILEEMAKIIHERQRAVTILEQKQTELQRFVDSLEKGPAESMKIFEEILAEQARKQDQESRKLACRYFIYGSLVTLAGTGVGLLVTFALR